MTLAYRPVDRPTEFEREALDMRSWCDDLMRRAEASGDKFALDQWRTIQNTIMTAYVRSRAGRGGYRLPASASTLPKRGVRR